MRRLNNLIVNVLSYFVPQIWLEMSKLPFIHKSLWLTHLLLLFVVLSNSNISNIPNIPIIILQIYCVSLFKIIRIIL